ncbi:MAG: hypothetical protein ACR2QM_10720 [Longimicrobiales bacterium]
MPVSPYRRFLASAAAVVFAASGCASGAGGPDVGDGGTRTTLISGPQTGPIVALEYYVEDNVVVHNVPVAAESMFGALEEAFVAAGLPAPVMDERSMTAYLSEHTVTRTIGERRMNRLLNCGDRVAGPVASASRVEITLVMEVHEAEGGTATVRTQLDAMADPFDSSIRSRSCTSTRQLEIQIVESAAALAGETGA